MNALRSSALKTTGLENSVLVMRSLRVGYYPLIAATGSAEKASSAGRPNAQNHLFILS
jgi:hypothetical protein